MKTGRRIANPSAKQLAGTFRKDRHAAIAPIAAPSACPPVRPTYMTVEGRLIWDEEIARITACGAVEADSSFIARYCEIEAIYRVSVMAGEVPSGTILTELRRMAELLGIACPRSRLTKIGEAGNAKQNTFTVMKK